MINTLFLSAPTYDQALRKAAELWAANSKLEELVVDQAATIVMLENEREVLERRLALNSGTSSKPPSSDGLKRKKPVFRAKDGEGRRTGGQPGHPGSGLELASDPDEVVDLYPTTCSCGHAFSPEDATGESAARQVHDLPPPRPLFVTEARIHACSCPRCGRKARARFPEGVGAPVKYGPRIEAAATALVVDSFLSEARAAKVLSDLVGATLTRATVATMVERTDQRLAPFAEHLAAVAAAAPVKGGDETGIRVNGRTEWLHVRATPELTSYTATEKRNAFPAVAPGTVLVCDGLKGYAKLPGVLIQACNVHHLRDLKALELIDREPWAAGMAALLRSACHEARLAREQGLAVSPEVRKAIESAYEGFLDEADHYHDGLPPFSVRGKGARGRLARRPGRNLADRLRNEQESVLRFLTDPSIPFGNNLSEQGMKGIKVKLKNCGCFRSRKGAERFARLRSTVETARKQSWDRRSTLSSTPDLLLANLKTA